MSEVKWTPGPWYPEKNYGEWVVMHEMDIICRIEQWSRSVDHSDACLIAAAPELYEACAEFLPILDRQLASINPGGAAEGSAAYQTASARVARMRAALAKARGETP